MQLAFINRKGGVAKTTTAINVAAAFASAADLGIAEKNFRTLLVDLDSQANASTGLGVPFSQLEPSICSLLRGEDQPRHVVRETAVPNLFLIAGSDRLASDIEPLVHQTPAWAGRLKQIMDIIAESVDVVIYDCPPARTALFDMVMLAADTFIIPLPVSHFSKEGLRGLLTAYAAHRDEHAGSAALFGILLTMMDYFPPFRQGEREDQLRAAYGSAVLETVIPKNKHLDDAQGARQTIFQFKADCAGADAYRNLTREIILRARDLMLLPEAETAAASV